MNDWLDPGFSVEVGVRAEPPNSLVMAAHCGAPIPLAAALVRLSSASTDYLFLVGLTVGVSEASTAPLLALALMDRQHALLEPTLMPPRPPMAVLRSDGTLRHKVTRTFSRWVLREIDRIGDLIRRDNPEILKAVTSALNGRASPVLETAPADFPPQFIGNTMLALPLAGLAEGIDWNEPPVLPRKRHHHVRSEYERDRQLAHLPLEDVLQRGSDIFRNLYQVDHLGRVSLDSEDPRLYYWIDRFTEYIHEFGLRGVDPRQFGPQLLADLTLPMHGDEWPRIVGEAVADFLSSSPRVLVRYGERAHIQDAWKHGVLRLGPATSYDDPSLDPARRDDEMALALDVDGTVLPVISDGQMGWISSSVRLSANASLRTNFLVHCLSSSLESRLFLDFRADAALIIRDPDEFRRRFERAAAKACSDWCLEAHRVTYYDPLNTTPGELRPPFWKHFRYAYQDEVRFVLVPPRPVRDLDPVFIELGSLEDISDPLFPDEAAL